MDPLTHGFLTRKFVGTERTTMVAGLAPDLPFYLTYPIWLLRRGQLGQAFRKNEWPQAPSWMVTCHHIFHSVPVLLLVAGLFYARRGFWPRAATAWLLHILIDLPTHSRRNWAPQVLWPFSSVTVDGISWPELAIRFIQHLYRR